MNLEDDGRPPIGPPTYTRDDQTQSQAYMSHRATLYELWELAETYPNVASKIRVRIRRADPSRDYRYDDEFADAAIVVSLSWIDTKRACEFLSCVATYPRDGRCRYGDEPRVYASGDSTTAVACQPACFVVRSGHNREGQPLTAAAIAAERYGSSVAHVMSVRSNDNSYRPYDSRIESFVVDDDTGHATKRRKEDEGETPSSSPSSSDTSTDPSRPPQPTDMPMLEYDESSDTCEIANAALFAYATQPFFRSSDDGSGKSVCRLTNFSIGDDTTRARFVVDGEPAETSMTARHSRSYCDGFDKRFDPAARTCHEAWWERVLSYTFVGSALVRLARHAVAGGDRCDGLLPAATSRAETNVSRDVPDVTLRSRAHWFADVDREWCLPPPNVLLSDLGIEEVGQIWSNENSGGSGVGRLRTVDSVEVAASRRRVTSRRYVRRSPGIDDEPSSRSLVPPAVVARKRRRDDDVSSTLPLNRDRWLAERLLTIDRRITTADAAARLADDRARTAAYVGRVADQDNDDNDGDTLLDFDAIYADALGKTNSAKLKELLQTLGITIGEIGGSAVAHSLVRYVMRSAYSRALRFVGRDLSGRASRTLIGLGVRATVARMTASVLTRFSTRIMTALATTASGIGTVLGLAELIGVVLDVMLLFGWDPGNYNSEFTNDVYDDLAVGWLRNRRFDETFDLTPELFLSIFRRNRDGAVVPDGGAGLDESSRARSTDDEESELTGAVRLAVDSVDRTPWFFAKFPRAVECLVRDNAPPIDAGGDGAEDPRRREYSNRRRAKFTFSVKDDDDPLRLRVRPVITDNAITTNMLLSTHYFAHRATNSLGQRVNTRNDAIRLDDDTIARAVRDNELADMLASAYSREAIPRSALIAAARRNVVSTAVDFVLIASLSCGFVSASLTIALMPGRARHATPTSTGETLRVSLLIALLTLVFALPLLLCVTSLESLARDHTERSFERPTVAVAATKTSVRQDSKVDQIPDIDAIDGICDYITEAISVVLNTADEEGSGSSSSQAGAIASVLGYAFANNLRNELRVVYNVD